MLTPEQISQVRKAAGAAPLSPTGTVKQASPLDSLLSTPPPLTPAQTTQKTVSAAKTGQQKMAETLNPFPKADGALGLAGDAIGGLANVGVGMVKGVGQTVKGLGTLGEKIGTGIGLPQLKGQEIFVPESEAAQKADAILEGASTGQKIGIGLEKALEFLLPASQASKGEAMVNTLSQGISSPLLAATTRVIGKGAVQGLAAGGVRMAQTGGDVEDSLKTAATAGVVRSGFATIGEGARALHIPEKLYSTFFKNNSKDMISQLRSGGMETLQKTNPEKFKSFVEQGIIHVDDAGQLSLDESLAKQALDRGLRGNAKTMADTVVHGALESENEARAIARNAPPIQLSTKQAESIKTTLLDFADDHKGVYSGAADEATALAEKIKINGNTPLRVDAVGSEAKMNSLLPDVKLKTKFPNATDLRYPKTEQTVPLSAEDTLALRRFFDKQRLQSSFNVQSSKQSLGQQNYKGIADALRHKLSELPGMADVMENYHFNIEALESIAKEAARRGNNQIIGLIDSNFIGNGLSSQSPAPNVIAAILRRYLLSAQGTTGLGQALGDSVMGPVTGAAGNAASAGVVEAVSD